MPGRRTTLATVGVAVVTAVLTAVLTAGCDDGRPGPEAEPTLALEVLGGDLPALAEELEVELATSVAVFGRGCRPQSAHHRCSADGTKTYSLEGALMPATVTSVWMLLDSGRSGWTVRVRFQAGGSAVLRMVAAHAEAAHGYVVVVSAHSGDVLQAVAPAGVRDGRIVAHGLPRLAAEHAVDTYVTAATGR